MCRFSRHCLERMKERAISREDALSIVNKEVDVVVYPSGRDDHVDLYFGKIGANHLVIIMNRKTKTLVTVRKMRKKEKAVYAEVMKR